MTDFDRLQIELTRDNALALLEQVACPTCGAVGDYQLFDELNNNGVGIRCRRCDKHHPFVRQRIMWLRGTGKRRSNDLVAVMQQCGFYCYACGCSFQDLQAFGIGMSVHHTRPFAESGESYAKIPVCNVCHEHLNLMQRMMRRFINAGS